jgi:hypothetical protein
MTSHRKWHQASLAASRRNDARQSRSWARIVEGTDTANLGAKEKKRRLESAFVKQLSGDRHVGESGFF